MKVPNKKGHFLIYFQFAKNLIRKVCRPEKAAGAELDCAQADGLFLNFLLLFVSRQKVRMLKRPKNILFQTNAFRKTSKNALKSLKMLYLSRNVN